MAKDSYLDCSASLAQREHIYPARPSKRPICFQYLYLSVVPQNEFAFQWIFVIATQLLKVIKGFSIEERDFSV